MQLVGARGQIYRDLIYDASGTITAGATPQLVLPEHRSRSFLLLQNRSATAGMYFEIGAGTATATISGGAVTSVAVGNPGFNYTVAPGIEFLGGGSEGNSTYTGAAGPGFGSPGTNAAWGPLGADQAGYRPAKAIAVLSGGTIGSITVLDGGAGYVAAPYVLIHNSRQDPNGCQSPSYNSGSGIYLGPATPPLILNGTACPTQPIGVYCVTTSAAFCAKFMV